MIKLTENEKELLNWVETCGCQDGLSGFSFSVSIDGISPLSNKVARGCLSDLIQKGYLVKINGDDWFYISDRYYTEIKAMVA